MESPNNSTEWENLVPLFPLPSIVFYPNTLLPLHIFESRYRQMITRALEGDSQIGMVLLRPGWENDYYGHPAIVSIGCMGKIEKHSKLPEGKYNILLCGLHRFRILKEVRGKVYRRAQVELLQEINDCDLSSKTSPIKNHVIEHLKQYLGNIPEGKKVGQDLNLETCTTLASLIDRIAYSFDLSIEEKQVFLEEQDVAKRADILHSVIDLKLQLAQLSRKFAGNGADPRMN
ncbi:MAG: LON peptidase substrate-binding domain-containing protein [Nitrospinaceae bacterium]|nr:LON peptidase substrate-binding domain-containing protein [Nitrospinaceae bacterium]